MKRLTSILILCAMCTSAIAFPHLQPCALASGEEGDVLFSNFNTLAVQNQPTEMTVFIPQQDCIVKSIITYHWNRGWGSEPGTIGLVRSSEGAVIGEWTASGLPGMGGAEDVNWCVYPDITLEKGVEYAIFDSDYSTWSHNAQSEGCGFSEIKGQWITTTAGSEASQKPERTPIQGTPIYTSSDYERAATTSRALTPDNHQVVFGAISVDMGKWNLNGPDEIIMKELAEKVDATGNATIRGYDFKLASGQSQFVTSSLIAIPITTEKDEDGSVVFLNEDKGEWEYIAYDLSEDGKNYIIYMPHFSTIGEKKVKKYVGTETDIRSTSGEIEAAGSYYQYAGFTAPDGSFIPLNERSIFLSENSFRLLYLNIQTEELKRILLVAKLPTQDATSYALGTLNNAQSAVDSAILMKGLENSLSPTGKIRLSGCMGSFGAALTAGRIAYQAIHGGSFSQILLENKADIAESFLGILSFGAQYIGAAGAASAFSVAAAIVYAGSLANSYVEAATEFDSYEERVYHFFMDKGKSKIDMTALTNYDFMDKLYPDGRNFDKVLKAIYDRYAGKPKELDEAVSRMYYSYASYFWKYLSPEERAEFAKKEYAGEVIAGITKWTEPSEQERQKYIEKTVARLASETEPMLRALAYDALAKMKQELYKTVQMEIEPYLNQMITFVVKDKGLKNDEYFTASAYAAYDIAFNDRKAPLFAAKDVSLSAYTDNKYTPEPREKSNVIYKCTMFHYIQMGCPTSITFKGDPKKELPAQTVPFEIDDSGSNEGITVNLELEADVSWKSLKFDGLGSDWSDVYVESQSPRYIQSEYIHNILEKALIEKGIITNSAVDNYKFSINIPLSSMNNLDDAYTSSLIKLQNLVINGMVFDGAKCTISASVTISFQNTMDSLDYKDGEYFPLIIDTNITENYTLQGTGIIGIWGDDSHKIDKSLSIENLWLKVDGSQHIKEVWESRGVQEIVEDTTTPISGDAYLQLSFIID